MRLILAVGLLAAVVGHATGEEFDARILKIADGKVTFRRGQAGQQGPRSAANEGVTLPLREGAKVLRATRILQGDRLELRPGGPLPGGLQSESLTNLDALIGTPARIVTADDGKAIKELWVWISPPGPQTSRPVALIHPPVPGGETDRDPLPPRALARLGTLRFRHIGRLDKTAVSANGRFLASAGNLALMIWNAQTGQAIQHWPLNRGDIGALAFSPDGKQLAVYHRSASLQIIEVGTGQTLKSIVLQLHSANRPRGRVESSLMEFLPDGQQILLQDGEEPVIHLLHAETGQEIRAYRGQGQIRAIALAPDGCSLAMAEQDGTVRVWDVHTGKERSELVKRSGICRALAFSPDSKLLVRGMGSGDASIWDATTGKELSTLAPRTQLRPPRAAGSDRQPAVARETSPGPVLSLSFSPDGRQLVSCHGFAMVLWDTATWKELRRFWQREPTPVSFLPDGQTLITFPTMRGPQSAFQFLNAKTGEPCRQFKGHNGAAKAIAFSPDGKWVATAGAGQVLVWDRASRRVVWQSAGRTGDGGVLAFSPMGDALAARTLSGLVVWDLATGKERWSFQQVSRPYIDFALAFSGDGKTLALANQDGTVRRFDLEAGKVLPTLRVAQQPVSALALSPDLRLAAVATQAEPIIHLWNLADGKEYKSIRRDGPGMIRLAFSPDGRSFVGSGSSHIVIYETTTGTRRLDLVGQQAADAPTWAPNGRYLAVAELDPPSRRDRMGQRDGIRLIDLAREHPPDRLLGHKGPVLALAFSPDNLLLASASQDTTALLWKLDAIHTARPPGSLTPEDLATCWEDLRGDAQQAYTSMWKLALNSGTAEFLRTKLKPAAAAPDPSMVRRLLTDLDSNEFTVRSKASRQLAALGPPVSGQLRQALASKPSADISDRLTKLLETLDRERIHGLRTVEVLDWMHTFPARQLLQSLAGGAPDDDLTREAGASLGRQLPPATTK